jgi:DNA-directed RNA polymerase specialized sigma24 family protein
MFAVSLPDDLDPRNWRLNVDQQCIDLYLSVLLGEPRALSSDECAQMVELVNSWRAQEQRKHMALMDALAALDPDVASQLLMANIEQFSGEEGESEPA